MIRKKRKENYEVEKCVENPLSLAANSWLDPCFFHLLLTNIVHSNVTVELFFMCLLHHQSIKLVTTVSGVISLFIWAKKRKTKTKRKKEKKKISHSSIKGIVSSLTFNQRAFHKTPRRATYSSGVRAHLAYPRLICFQLTTVVKNGYGHPEGHKTLKNDINIYSTNASFNMI